MNLVECKLSDIRSIFNAMVRHHPKTVENPGFIVNSSYLPKEDIRRIKKALCQRVRRNGKIPYYLRFFTGPGIAFYWEFMDDPKDDIKMREHKRSVKRLFDEREARGSYPRFVKSKGGQNRNR